MFTVSNEAGALGKAISIIGDNEFNLKALKSRPTKELVFSYYFYAEGEGNIITNIAWDASLNEGKGGVRVFTKTLTTITDEFASEGMVASYNNGTLVIRDATKKAAVTGASLS